MCDLPTAMQRETSGADPLVLCIVHLEPGSSCLCHGNFHRNHFPNSIMQMNVALQHPSTTHTKLSSCFNGNVTARKCEGETIGKDLISVVCRDGRMTDRGWQHGKQTGNRAFEYWIFLVWWPRYRKHYISLSNYQII